jgi:hypothetical protein
MKPILPIVAAALLAGTACYEEDVAGPPGGATANVLLTDAPFPFDSVASVNIYVVRIAASTSVDTSAGGTQQWVTITAPKKRYDLLQLQQGKTELIGAGQLPVGSYKAVRMVIDTDSSDIRMNDGREATVHWPVAGELTLNALVESPVAVPDAGADIVIDFDVGRSFLPGNPLADPMPGQQLATGEFIFISWIRAVNRAATGAISGVVRGDRDGDGVAEPIPNAAVTVFQGNDTSLALYAASATGRTDANGQYKIAFLNPGQYTVQVDPLGLVQLESGWVNGVSVAAGATAQVNVDLPQRNLAYLLIEGLFVLDSGQSTVLVARVGTGTGTRVAAPVVTWSSSTTAVATITSGSESATLTARAPGFSQITASSNGLSSSVTVYVFGADSSGTGTGGGGGAVATVTLSPANATVSVGDSLGFYANLTNATGGTVSNRPVQWVVQDSTVVWTIGAFGQSLILRAAKAGSTKVIATSEGKADTASVVVTP